MYALPAFHRGIILEVTSNRRVAVVIIKASYFEVFIGVTLSLLYKRVALEDNYHGECLALRVAVVLTKSLTYFYGLPFSLYIQRVASGNNFRGNC